MREGDIYIYTKISIQCVSVKVVWRKKVSKNGTSIIYFLPLLCVLSYYVSRDLARCVLQTHCDTAERNRKKHAMMARANVEFKAKDFSVRPINVVTRKYRDVLALTELFGTYILFINSNSEKLNAKRTMFIYSYKKFAHVSAVLGKSRSADIGRD